MRSQETNHVSIQYMVYTRTYYQVCLIFVTLRSAQRPASPLAIRPPMIRTRQVIGPSYRRRVEVSERQARIKQRQRAKTVLRNRGNRPVGGTAAGPSNATHFAGEPARLILPRLEKERGARSTHH